MSGDDYGNRRYFPVQRIQHRNEPKPNEVLPGYHHVSVAGPYRSTLDNPFSRRKFRTQMSARQRRKHDKAVRRCVRLANAEDSRVENPQDWRKTRHAVYCGPEVGLLGRGALVRPTSDGRFVVQLDMKNHPELPDELQDPRCYGWHPFAASDFA